MPAFTAKVGLFSEETEEKSWAFRLYLRPSIRKEISLILKYFPCYKNNRFVLSDCSSACLYAYTVGFRFATFRLTTIKFTTLNVSDRALPTCGASLSQLKRPFST